MQLISYIVTALLFMGPCVLAYLGWQVEGKNVGFITSFYPSFYLLLLTHFYCLYRSKKYRQVNKPVTWLFVICCTCYIFFKLLFGRDIPRMVLFNSIVLPAMYGSFHLSLHHFYPYNKYSKYFSPSFAPCIWQCTLQWSTQNALGFLPQRNYQVCLLSQRFRLQRLHFCLY